MHRDDLLEEVLTYIQARIPDVLIEGRPRAIPSDLDTEYPEQTPCILLHLEEISGIGITAEESEASFYRALDKAMEGCHVGQVRPGLYQTVHMTLPCCVRTTLHAAFMSREGIGV